MGISIDGPNLTLFTLNKQSPMGKLQRQENSHRSETSYSAVMHKGKVIFTLMCLTFVCFGSGNWYGDDAMKLLKMDFVL